MEVIVELLRTAAANRSSINQAANRIEEADDTRSISAREVVAAICAREAQEGDEPAGEYWDQCLRAAAELEKRS